MTDRNTSKSDAMQGSLSDIRARVENYQVGRLGDGAAVQLMTHADGDIPYLLSLLDEAREVLDGMYHFCEIDSCDGCLHQHANSERCHRIHARALLKRLEE
jgi:hypothetical protein